MSYTSSSVYSMRQLDRGKLITILLPNSMVRAALQSAEHACSDERRLCLVTSYVHGGQTEGSEEHANTR